MQLRNIAYKNNCVQYRYPPTTDQLQQLRAYFKVKWAEQQACDYSKPRSMQKQSHEFYLMNPQWRPPHRHHFRGWGEKEEEGLTAYNVVELLLLSERSQRFFNYCLRAYVQVAGGESGRTGSLNTQFGT